MADEIDEETAERLIEAARREANEAVKTEARRRNEELRR